ncbi:transferase [Streptomyces sp. SID14436]|uniref:Transferase n=3 Tax=unclassified Streptomyces TaxID=2593676 RepID=A0A6G3QQD5_9ACTN|nr:transferase [Streptomyces sp. SID14436]NEA85400.1 transferase [Streptomyces sp. SID14436]
MTAGERDPHPRADCTADASGRLTVTLCGPAPEHARLALVRRPGTGRPEEEPLLIGLRQNGDEGRPRAELPPEPALEEGRWDTYLLTGPDGTRRRLRPRLRDVRALVDGRRRDRPSPVAVRVPYTTRDGFLAVRAWLRTAHAEAGPLTLDDGALTVRARLHGARCADGAAAVLRLRGRTGTVRELPVETDGRDVAFTVPHTGPVDDGDHIWDVYVRPAADAPLIRVGRLLDDVADRKRVHVYPRVTVGGSGLRPYYTVDNDLSFAVTRAAEG